MNEGPDQPGLFIGIDWADQKHDCYGARHAEYEAHQEQAMKLRRHQRLPAQARLHLGAGERSSIAVRSRTAAGT